MSFTQATCTASAAHEADGTASTHSRRPRTAPHHPDQLDDLQLSLAHSLEACCDRRPCSLAATFDSIFFVFVAAYNTKAGHVCGYACASVVIHMRALDSYRDWVRASVKAASSRGNVHDRCRQKLDSSFVALVGLPARLQSSPLRRSRVLGVTNRRRRQFARSLATARSENAHQLPVSGYVVRAGAFRISSSLSRSVATLVIRLEVAACRWSSGARSGCDTQTPANLLIAAPTPVLMILPPTWLGCVGLRI